MLRTAIRLLTSLLMLWATPGYCGTEWERAVWRLDDLVVQGMIKNTWLSIHCPHITATYSLAMSQGIPEPHIPPLKAYSKPSI